MSDSRPSLRAVLAGIGQAEVVRVDGARAERVRDDVAVEEPLEVRLAGDTFQITMRTPGSDPELVAGLLLAEGVIASRDDLGSIVHCGRPGEPGSANVVNVTPAPGGCFAVEPNARRSAVVTAACGVCGRATIDDLVRRLGERTDTSAFAADWLAGLPAELARQQPNFSRTGGLHAAGAAVPGEPLQLVREDVGRHNAVDKVVGRLLLDARLPLSGAALVVSGRVGFEIVQKALCAGFSALVSVSAPSSLAVATAARFGLVLLGFARGSSFNIYAGHERVT